MIFETSEIQILPIFIKPFTSLLPYYFLSLILSLIIIISIVALEWTVKSFDIILLTFDTMLKIDRRRLRCFNVDITLTPQYSTIIHSCGGMMRIMVTTVLCFLWQSCFFFQRTHQMNNGHPDFKKIHRFCQSGLVCVYYRNSFEVFVLWARGNNVCRLIDQDPNQIQHEVDFTNGYLTCVGIYSTDSLGIVARLAISYALVQLFIKLFQLFTWFIFRSKTRFLSSTYLIFSVLLFILYFITLFVPRLFFVDTWFTSAGYLSFPATLLYARSVGMAAREVLNQQLSLRETIRLEKLSVELSQTLLPTSGLSSPTGFFSPNQRLSLTTNKKTSSDLYSNKCQGDDNRKTK